MMAGLCDKQQAPEQAASAVSPLVRDIACGWHEALSNKANGGIDFLDYTCFVVTYLHQNNNAVKERL